MEIYLNEFWLNKAKFVLVLWIYIKKRRWPQIYTIINSLILYIRLHIALLIKWNKIGSSTNETWAKKATILIALSIYWEIVIISPCDWRKTLQGKRRFIYDKRKHWNRQLHSQNPKRQDLYLVNWLYFFHLSIYSN